MKILQQALKKIGELLTAEFRATIGRKTSSRATGALKRSIGYEVVKLNDGMGVKRVKTMIDKLDEYGYYVDAGVRGTESKYAKNPQSVFNIGQFTKPIINKSSGLPFPVRISIAQKGLKPKPFINPSISNVMGGEGMDILEEALVKEVTINISNNLEDITIG